MNASEAREMYQASLRHAQLVTQVVPSPLTYDYDATIQDIIKQGTLGELLYIEVSTAYELHDLKGCADGLQRGEQTRACALHVREGKHIADTAGNIQVNFCSSLSVHHGHGSADTEELVMLQVRALTNSFAEADGAPLTWRTDQRYSGLNIGVLGIFYEPLQRCA